MSSANQIKIQRYQSTIKEIISEAINNEIYDSLIKLATIVDVRLTNDKSIVKIYISCYDKTLIDKVVTKINGASGFFRTILAKELNWYRAPKVVFVKDTTREKFDEVEDIINSWKEKPNGK